MQVHIVKIKRKLDWTAVDSEGSADDDDDNDPNNNDDSDEGASATGSGR